MKKSAWIRRRSEVLTEAFDMGECDPIKIEEYNNFSDPQTKYLVYRSRLCVLHEYISPRTSSVKDLKRLVSNKVECSSLPLISHNEFLPWLAGVSTITLPSW